MRKFFEEGKLTTEAISAIMSEEKPNQREKIVLRGDRVRNLIPKNIPINQTEEYVCKADRKSTRLNSSHSGESRMPSSA